MLVGIRHLRSLQAIQINGSLSRATQQLHLALSHQIKALENYYCVPLFFAAANPCD